MPKRFSNVPEHLREPHHVAWSDFPFVTFKKWFRDLAVAETMRDALMPFKDEWLKKLEELGREKKKAIDEYRRESRKQ